MKTNIHFCSNLAQFLLEWEMCQSNVVEKIRTQILRSITFFFENRAVYEIMCENLVERGRPQMTIWRIRIEFWISKATHTHTHTHTHRICNTYCFPTATMITRTRLNVTLHGTVHCPDCSFRSTKFSTHFLSHSLHSHAFAWHCI